jgi:hypothetical protein
MKIYFNGYILNLQENDEIELDRLYCGKCETYHDIIGIVRGGKTIAKFGDGVRLNFDDEVYGGAVFGRDGNLKSDYEYVVHIISGMTEDRMKYLTHCGQPIRERDRIIFNQSEIHYRDKDRICKDCLKVIEDKAKA